MSWKLLALCLAVIFLLAACRKKQGSAGESDEFLRLSNVGKAHLDRGEAQAAFDAFARALGLNPNHPDAKLNLANANLLADKYEHAAKLAGEVLAQEPGNPAALYVLGVSFLRQHDFTNAIKNLQQAKDIDIRVNAVSVQLGLAYEALGKFDEALAQYEEIAQFEPNFPGLHFRLSQVYARLNRSADAAAQLQQHQQWLAKNPNANLTAAAIAKCKYTEARIPFELEQPDREGIQVVFADATAEAFSPAGGTKFMGPVGVIDFARNGTNHLLVRDGDSFRLLLNAGGKFGTNEQSFPFTNGGSYTRWLVADLNKDAVPDALVLGDHGVHLFRFATNGMAMETTRFAGLKDFAAVDGLLADLNFRGDLDLVTVSTTGELRIISNLQNMYFVDTTTNAPALSGVRQLATDDWNNDETQDLFLSRGNEGMMLLLKERGGAWSNASVSLSLQRGERRDEEVERAGSALAIGDMNNDLRPDLVVASSNLIAVIHNGATNRASWSPGGFSPGELKLIDYDNDGWLDVFVLNGARDSNPASAENAPNERAGLETRAPSLRVFRNLGANGFRDVTASVGLDKLQGRVNSFAAADFDNDCDTDFVVSLGGGGLHFLRNNGGNKNHQLRLTLQGTRSNSSGLGVRIDVAAGGLRVARRVREWPIEIGVGKHRQLDSVSAQWFELSPSYTDISLTNCEPLRIIELALPTGSCPYLYCWDGERTRFVSDILCSAPLGLPIAPGTYVEADEDEIVRLGDERNFRPRLGAAKPRSADFQSAVSPISNRPRAETAEGMIAGAVVPSAITDTKESGGHYVVQITEELREVLYLDEAKLIVVDHAPRTEVHPTTKMLPGKSSQGFGRHELMALHNRLPLHVAFNDKGADVTRAVSEFDETFASPSKLREPQLRGLAEPHSVTMDFGALPTEKPFVLALTGWLRFGGGMANIAASSYASFPFPFPTVEAEANGAWQLVNVEVGAPSGRAKTILVDLAHKLPAGTRRLRVTAAFEIHWDRIALFERADAVAHVARLAPSRTDLHRRGYSEMTPLPRSGRGHETPIKSEIRNQKSEMEGGLLTLAASMDQHPTLLVPSYDKPHPTPLWRITPGGWATRYGAVDELVAARDNALVLVAGGDELTLEFAADKLPPKAVGVEREFFLFLSGWDKDSDFHVASGTTIEPMPWHGQNDQVYATQSRPAFTNDGWIQKYNTRWVGERVTARRR
jgi:tetratricopeptide (TPR) repeat protein